MAGGARGWLRVGQAFGVLLLPGLGSAALTPRFLGTQPPCATQALIELKAKIKGAFNRSYAVMVTYLTTTLTATCSPMIGQGLIFY